MHLQIIGVPETFEKCVAVVFSATRKFRWVWERSAASIHRSYPKGSFDCTNHSKKLWLKRQPWDPCQVVLSSRGPEPILVHLLLAVPQVRPASWFSNCLPETRLGQSKLWKQTSKDSSSPQTRKVFDAKIFICVLGWWSRPEPGAYAAGAPGPAGAGRSGSECWCPGWQRVESWEARPALSVFGNGYWISHHQI